MVYDSLTNYKVLVATANLIYHKLVFMKAYLDQNDYNVIMVDWEPLAASTFYLGPMHNTQRVGKVAAEFIDFLIAQTGLQAENIHFLGTWYFAKPRLSRKKHKSLIIYITRTFAWGSCCWKYR